MTYKLFVPTQATGTSVVFFDLFNASGSACEVSLTSVQPLVSGAVAVTGVIGVDVYLTRTSAVGTGGTAAVNEGTSITACTITDITGSQPVNALIMARLTPSGGATAGALIACRTVYTEETNAGTYVPQPDMVRTPIRILQGTGVRVVQNAIASVGNIGFDVEFEVIRK